jgi:two-component system CheB/CheR fusion protein
MEEDSEAGALGSILKLLRAHSRHNLSEYKSSTLQRRIQRRMGVHGLLTREAYVAFIQQNPQELDLLFKEVLIGVTSFFRDPAVWDELKDSVLPALIVSSAPGARLRAWVAGCSTGEEAYSLAMVFAEVAATLPGLPRTLQIFASDLSADAIAAARRGSFHARIASEMSSERLARFFVARGKGYTIAKGIREMMLFAQHDLIQDPPFTRLDLLSCRNLLIYFDASLQRRLIPLFGYSLRPGGVLLLGGSETIGNATAQFSTISSKARLYSRNQLPVVGTLLDFPVGSHWPTSRPKKDLIVQPNSVTPPANLQALAEHALLMEFSPPAVVVNSQGDVIFINGSVGKYLEPAAGKANWNVHVMARPAIRAQIAAALRQAQQDDKPVELRGLKLDDGALATLDVIVKTLHEPKALTGLVMMVFREVAGPVGRRRRKTSADAPNPELARELQSLKDEVNALRQQMGSSAEELQAANEELQSTNEELQSANEELTTSKEESQSMNEELQTLNSELQSKLDDLALAQSDMQNLLNSTDIATLFLDSELNVRRFTEQITRIFQLRDIDIGRPLTDLASTLIYPGMYADARDTLRSLSFTEKQIATTDGLWFMVRIKPYRTLSNVIQGVVVTLIDITAAKELESRLRKA